MIQLQNVSKSFKGQLAAENLNLQVNPVMFFQTSLNSISKVYYAVYLQFRDGIQALIDKRTAVLVKEFWDDIKVDK